ncbi:MAG: type II toxin-antitoxin system VapC family toxin [Ardenticatenaceae bacterium]|nr:type II toxin-antitoxin system VapC family toxin [Ardenticatenaceae bacterium]
MNLLLDTHVFLWFIAGDKQLDSYARHLIEDLGNERFLSVASVWEITIKSSLGRLAVPTPPSALVRDHIWANAINLLAIKPEHLDTLHDLPGHHKDPFDRLIIAQAIHEKMTLLTKDSAFSQYDVQTLWSFPENE